MKKLLIAIAAAGLATAAMLTPALAAPNPNAPGQSEDQSSPFATLDGEILVGTSSVQASCTVTGTDTIAYNWTVSGTASGPYPGTFTETGSASGLLSNSLPTSASADFTITSGNTTITGHKDANPGFLGSLCPSAVRGASGPPQVGGGALSYTASTSRNKNQTYCDSGSSSIDLNGSNLPAGDYFMETYSSSQQEMTKC